MDRLMNADVFFGSITTAAQELIKAEKQGGPIPDKFDFGVKEVCSACQQNIMPPKKVMRCAACKAAIYCGKECAVRGWNTPLVPNAPTHKQLCAANKRHMEKLPQTQAIVKSFPWGRIENDGSFSRDLAKGRFKVLGGSDFGFWSHRGGPIPHSDVGPIAQEQTSPYAAMLKKMLSGFDHLDGKDLLKDRHLSDKEGWKLAPELIPCRTFISAEKRPVLVTEFNEGVKDWDSWYRWRKLSKDSPVALLMHSALSVYQMLVHCLEVTTPVAGKKDKRIPLHVHLLGVEVEMNYLPTFSELALLLPFHDIKLVVFGGGVAKLLAEASKTKSAVANASPTFRYEAPPELGSGSISIHLHGDSPFWSASPAMSKYGSPPDALVACNAGLGSYREWIPVIRDVHRIGIPFATTEYAEQSAETQRGSMGMIVAGYTQARKESEYRIEMNPFQCPGQRGIPMYRLPNVVNGFTLVVWKNESSTNLKKVEDTIADSLGGLDLD